jgi:hypothetical protein
MINQALWMAEIEAGRERQRARDEMMKKNAERMGWDMADKDPICPNCKGSAMVRNPSGSCDHLNWPDYLTPEAKEKIGFPELMRIREACMLGFASRLRQLP